MRELAAQLETETAERWFSDEVVDAAAHSARPATMIERSAPHGAMAPLLRRDEREVYRLLEGQVVFFVGKDLVWARPGDVVVAAAGVERTFRVDSVAGARWLVVTHVRSLQAFTDFGRAVSAPVAGWPSESERAAVEAMAAINGIELLGPPGALPGRR